MLVNDNFATSQTATTYNSSTPQANAANQDITDYIRGMATDLERLSQQAGLSGVAACLRAAVAEARRAKNNERLLKLGVTPDRRLG
jgi:orotidine-5'-phosphate decarboxylase